LLTYSNYDASAWPQTTASVSINSAISPDGYQNAITATRTSSSNARVGTAVFSGIVGQPYTGSVYLRKVSGSGVVYIVNINNTASTLTITNEWQRYSVTASSAAATTLRLYFDMSADGDVIEFWQGQIELGSYATSLIPTLGAAVTRLADGAVKTGISSLLGASEGVVFLEVGDTQNNAVTGPEVWYFEMRKDQDNSFGLASGGGPTQPIRFVTKIAGTAVTEGEPAPFANSKIAIKYTSTQFKVFRNGSLVLTTNKSIGNYAEIQFMEGAGLNLSMVFNQFMIFKTALTDAQCTELTTL
jgi:hypothetical protein